MYLREQDDSRWLVALNFSDTDQVVVAPDVGSGHVIISTYCDRTETVDLGELRLRPNEGCMVELRAG